MINEVDAIIKTINDMMEINNNIWKDYADFICENNIELWKPIPDFPNYEISTLGNIKVAKSGRSGSNGVGTILKYKTDEDNYCSVKLTNNKVKTTLRIHRLVAKVFIHNNNPKINIEVDHINKDKTNNKINNL